MGFIKPTLVAALVFGAINADQNVKGLDVKDSMDLTEVARSEQKLDGDKAKIMADVKAFGQKLSDRFENDVAEHKDFVNEATTSKVSVEQQKDMYSQFEKAAGELSKLKYTMDDEYNLTKVDDTSNDDVITDADVANQRPRVIYFASHSMGDEELADLFIESTLTKNAIVVFRGFAPGIRSIDKGTEWMYTLVNRLMDEKKMKTVPSVTIDPVLFEKYNIDKVPAMVLIDDKEWDIDTPPVPTLGSEPIYLTADSKVYGLTNAKWLYDKKAKGEVGNFGVQAKVFDIEEPDLIKLMQQIAKEYDWQAAQERAISNIWKNYQFYTLPPAMKTRVRNIDLTITVPQDIKNEEGKILFPKGMKVDPFATHKFDFALIVYNPTRKGELKVVEEQLKRLEHKQGVNKVILIATEIDRVTGSDDLIKIEDRFDKPFFLNKPEITKRFNLEYTPSVVELIDDKVAVTEIALSDSEEVDKKEPIKTEKSRASIELPEVVTNEEIDEIKHIKPRMPR